MLALLAAPDGDRPLGGAGSATPDGGNFFLQGTPEKQWRARLDAASCGTGGVESAGVAAFFIPGCTPGVDDEVVYTRIVAAAAADTGHPPRPLRIFRLSFRHRGADLEAEVGMPDPVQGRTVLAILDLGRESPYMLHCRSAGGLPEQVLVRKPVYSVTEFAP
jgi:hypothetical protein